MVSAWCGSYNSNTMRNILGLFDESGLLDSQSEYSGGSTGYPEEERRYLSALKYSLRG